MIIKLFLFSVILVNSMFCFAQCVPTMNSIREDIVNYKIRFKKLNRQPINKNLKKIKMLINKGKFRKAKKLLKIEINKDKNDYKLYLYLGIVDYNLKNFKKAIVSLKRGLNEFEIYKKEYEKEKFKIINDFEKEYPILLKRLDDYQSQYITPSSHGLSYNASNQINKLKLMKERIEKIKNEKIYFPSNFRLKLANSYFKLGNFKMAEYHYKKGIEENPNSKEFQNNLNILKKATK